MQRSLNFWVQLWPKQFCHEQYELRSAFQPENSEPVRGKFLVSQITNRLPWEKADLFIDFTRILKEKDISNICWIVQLQHSESAEGSQIKYSIHSLSFSSPHMAENEKTCFKECHIIRHMSIHTSRTVFVRNTPVWKIWEVLNSFPV